MVDDKTTQIIKRIKILWWGSVGSILIYSSTVFLFGSFPHRNRLSILWDNKELFTLLTLSLSAVTLVLSYTLVGKKRFLKASNLEILMRLVVIRLVLSLVPVILGIFIFMIIHSYLLYIPFFFLSILSLLLQKNEEKFYIEILHKL